MRDYAVFIAVFGLLPYILRHPYIGVLTWSWLSYMNPHRLGWGAAYDFPFAQIVAITLFTSLFFSREPKRLPMTGLVVLWMVFVVWMLITTLAAVYPDEAWIQLVKVLKIQLIIFLAMMIMGSAERIRMMIWVIFFSVGFFGIKGGVFTITTGGGARVWGPAGSFIQDNNPLAIALLMILPLGYYLIRHQAKDQWIKVAVGICMVLITFAIIGSYSRGAFLAIICVAGFLWLKSRNKLVIGVGILPLLPLVFLFMPEGWHDRMATIGEYESDGSAMGRINAWYYAINVATARLTGAGFESWHSATFALWAPDPLDVHAAHSIYFAVLGDHGWPGLLMFVAIFVWAWRIAARMIRVTREHPDYRWVADLSAMLQVSMVAYAVGGAFLSLAYFDLPWHFVAIIILLERYLESEGVVIQHKPTFAEQQRAARGVVASGRPQS